MPRRFQFNLWQLLAAILAFWIFVGAFQLGQAMHTFYDDHIHPLW
ncbi:MAG TPA: hypothetical protein VFI31_30530 [Pirellulales bacterium]|nr:hypothetical protein [Pirellulales bacterium]